MTRQNFLAKFFGSKINLVFWTQKPVFALIALFFTVLFTFLKPALWNELTIYFVFWAVVAFFLIILYNIAKPKEAKTFFHVFLMPEGFRKKALVFLVALMIFSSLYLSIISILSTLKFLIELII